MNRKELSRRMRCPNCHSLDTEFVPTSYALTRQSLHYRPTENDFHGAIQRPERRSTVILPIAALVIVYAFSIVAIVQVHLATRASWRLADADWPAEVLLPAFIPAVIVALLQWHSARRYNRDTFPGEYNEWSTSAICRRCSTVFEAPSRVIAAFRARSQ